MTQLTDEEIDRCLVEANRLPGFQSGIDIARAVIAAYEAKQREGCEPVAEIVIGHYGGDKRCIGFTDVKLLPAGGRLLGGTKLYTHPSEDARDALARIRLLVERIDEDRKAKDWQSMHANISELLDAFTGRHGKAIAESAAK